MAHLTTRLPEAPSQDLREELQDAQRRGLSLTATQCRRLLGKVLATARFADPEHFCEPDFPIPPDKYSMARLRAWPTSQKRYSTLDLARLLRGKRVSFVGDSLTGQVTNALECSFRRTAQPLETAVVKVHVPGLRAQCDALWDAVYRGNNASGCDCRVKELASWKDSACRLLSRASAREARDGQASSSFELWGTRATRHNITWFKRFGDVYQYVRACPTCRRNAVAAASGGAGRTIGPSGRAHGPRGSLGTPTSGVRGALTMPQCEQYDFCAARSLPRHVEMVRHADVADVIILNFGLWCVEE